jgi:hypothetical protein
MGTGLVRVTGFWTRIMKEKYGPVTPKIRSCKTRCMSEKKLPL